MSLVALATGLVVNPSRKNPTLFWFPQFVYIEHLFGYFAIGIIFFCLFFGVLYTLKIVILKKEFRTNISSMLSISKNLGLIIALFVSLYYELLVQKLATIQQLPFDIFGIFGYWFYIRWAYSIPNNKRKNLPPPPSSQLSL